MGIERCVPPADLLPYFREYYFCDFRTEGADFIPVIDDGCHDLVFFREQNSVLSYGTKGVQLPVASQVFTILGLTPPYRILLNTSLSFFTIKVQPWYNSAFFPGSSKKGIVDMPDFLGTPTAPMHLRLFTDMANSARFDLVSTWLRKQLEENEPEKDDMVSKICEQIYAHRGMITVNHLEELFGHSRQYLNSRFKRRVSYGLKNFILKVRILDLIKRRINTPNLSFTSLAHEYEYFDQAHFNRDFKRVTGLPPGKFFEDLAPFLERHRT